MVMRKKDAKPLSQATENVTIPELGGSGEVTVRALLLRERLKLATMEMKEYGHIAAVLSLSVYDADGPLYAAQEWEIFGSQEGCEDAAFKLFEVAQRISGLGSKKKTAAPSDTK